LLTTHPAKLKSSSLNDVASDAILIKIQQLTLFQLLNFFNNYISVNNLPTRKIVRRKRLPCMQEHCPWRETCHELNVGRQRQTRGRAHHAAEQEVGRQTEDLFSLVNDQSASESQPTLCLQPVV